MSNRVFIDLTGFEEKTSIYSEVQGDWKIFRQFTAPCKILLLIVGMLGNCAFCCVEFFSPKLGDYSFLKILMFFSELVSNFLTKNRHKKLNTVPIVQVPMKSWIPLPAG